MESEGHEVAFGGDLTLVLKPQLLSPMGQKIMESEGHEVTFGGEMPLEANPA